MVNIPSVGTGKIPLKLAEAITQAANKEWRERTLLGKVQKTTQDLLRFWDPKGAFADLRRFNFHDGQWQAILNAIYVQEVLNVKHVRDLYLSTNPELLQEMDLTDFKKEKYAYPKYCVKMATGTGKTWVLSALLIWQFLNAKHTNGGDKWFSKNFLLIAPGIIVYERLLDAYLGKRRADGVRDFDTSDFKRFEDLFVPVAYREEVFGFLHGCVAEKEEIGKRVTGEGLIAVTNWHLIVGEEETEDGTSLDSPEKTIRKLLPIAPGTSTGNSLE